RLGSRFAHNPPVHTPTFFVRRGLAPRRDGESVRRPAAGFAIDLALACVLFALIAGVITLAQRWKAPMREAVVIDLSPRALPGYTLLSLSRGFAAYLLSLLFTLIYGTIAAHSRRAEKVMIPLLDIAQGIPVLGFLPGLVLGMVALFPRSNVGLELACILMIFTGQVWNMVFSFYGSLRSVPQELREVARIHRFGWWKTFKTVEVSGSVIGLVWNSMISMAGGWFFLTVNEAFTLGDRDFRLPGVGSYMAVAIEKGDRRAMTWAIVAMTLMILAVDQLLWKPLVAWSQRFRLEDISGSEPPRSWVLDLLRRSWIARRLRQVKRESPPAAPVGPAHAQLPPPAVRSDGAWFRTALLAIVGIAAAAGAVAGAWHLVLLLVRVSAREWGLLAAALGATFLRTAGALAVGALWCVPAGILIGRSAVWSRRLQPVVQLVASFPAPMVFPLVTAALLAVKVPFSVIAAALMLLGAQWYILFNVLAGASSIPHDLEEASDTYAVRGRERWRKLFLPSVFPYLVTGLITAAGGAWNASIVAETLTYRGKTLETFGLGTLITRSTQHANFPLLAAGVLTMSAALVLINRTVWRPLYRLAESRYALNR
ncbi:MAG TPA: ABC transporter permease subunit, partial [Thermoanaerobaculia bacterium]|nr:ABC transporter permease subunit [Thermoanaerobaculia bacterium]